MNLKMNKTLSMISLATKAGKTLSGEFLTEKEVKEGRAHLVIIAGDASANTKKKFQNMCDFYKVPIYFYGDKGISTFYYLKMFFQTIPQIYILYQFFL